MRLWRAVPLVDFAEARLVTREGPRLPCPRSMRIMFSAPWRMRRAAFTTFRGLRFALRRPELLAAACRPPAEARPRLRPATVPLLRITSPRAPCDPRCDLERETARPGSRPREDAPLLLVRLLPARVGRAADSPRPALRFARREDEARDEPDREPALDEAALREWLPAEAAPRVRPRPEAPAREEERFPRPS